MIVKLGNEEINLNEENLKFSEETINQFLQKYAALYNYYMEKHADAQYVHSKYKDKHDKLMATKFVEFKEKGGSDKLCEANAIKDAEVQECMSKMASTKRTVNLLWGYLRAMDKSFDASREMCFNMRKEMDKIFGGSIKKTWNEAENNNEQLD